jgi:hypothetical protein
MGISIAKIVVLVGARGFEPPTSCSQSKRATRLRYAPIGKNKFLDHHTCFFEKGIEVFLVIMTSCEKSPKTAIDAHGFLVVK